jgi:hypothetical protein
METLKNKKVQITIGALITLGMFIIGITNNYTTGQNAIETRLCNLEEKMTAIATSVGSLQTQKHADDVRYTEIKVKLTSIEATLVEIKASLK